MSGQRIDWAGLSWRTVRGWRHGSQCLARCGSMHTGGRWCQLDRWKTVPGPRDRDGLVQDELRLLRRLAASLLETGRAPAVMAQEPLGGSAGTTETPEPSSERPGEAEPVKRLPAEWARIKRIRIVDPDGWRNTGRSWDDPVGEGTFMILAAVSTLDLREQPLAERRRAIQAHLAEQERKRETALRLPDEFVPCGDPDCPEPVHFFRGETSYGTGQRGHAGLVDTEDVQVSEVLEADDTVPVERLAQWLHGEFDSSAELSDLLPWAQERESVKDLYRAGARKLRADLPELFR